jgi:RIO-like serine/threonine protein kinase
MFPEKADLIQKEGEIEYNKYKRQTKRSWDDINTIEEKVKEAEKEIDRVNQLQSSGDSVPMPQLESLLQKIDSLKASQADKDMLENEAVQMQSFSDGERLKELLRKIQGIS